MGAYLQRILDAELRRYLRTFGAVILQGPRAVGKTTTALSVAASSVRLDASPAVSTLAEMAPGTVLVGPTPRLIDEWQLAPPLWNAVRHEVDQRGKPGQFILTGSATPSDDVTRHSGAGRFKRLTLRPMTLFESGEATGAIEFGSLLKPGPIAAMGGPTVEEYASLIVRGGWPALVGDQARHPTDYLSSYLDDVARVDMPTNDIRVDPQRMRALIRTVARNIATEVSAVQLSKEAEIEELASGTTTVSAQSVRKYLDALTRVFVLEEQPAWTPHLRSKVRIRVSPKWHFVDPSLAAAALGAGPQHLLSDLNTLDLLFESLCVRDLRVYAETVDGHVSHYRDETGLEVDCIVETSTGSWAAFEVKLGGKEQIERAASNLVKLADKVSSARREDLVSLNVLTAGEVSYTRPDGVNVVSLGHLGATRQSP